MLFERDRTAMRMRCRNYRYYTDGPTNPAFHPTSHTVETRIHPGLARLLSRHELPALEQALDHVQTLFLNDISRTTDDDQPAHGAVFRYLPERFERFYTGRLLRRWHLCYATVTARLSEGTTPLRCRAEQLALGLLLDHARSFLDPTNLDLDTHYWRFEQAIEPDHRYVLLWNPDIDDPTSFVRRIVQADPMHPTTWFEPLDPARPIHPLLQHRPAGDA